jgi:pyrroloquinoline quinone biosynthesis protein E
MSGSSTLLRKFVLAEIPLSLNFVIHRRNNRSTGPNDHPWQKRLGPRRVELANVQFYGWAFRNRAALLPTREQVDRARDIAIAAKARLAGKIDIFMCCPIIMRRVQNRVSTAGANVISR